MIEEFISDFERKAGAYIAWGKFVASEIFGAIKLDSDLKDNFLKIPIQQRLKKVSSIKGKILLNDLVDPASKIKDLYGIRFVVLLSSDVRIVEAALTSRTNWDAIKSRDFGADGTERAESFDYQSVHYNVTCTSQRILEGVTIDTGICCEVQIRTMLQHAYAELTHDNIYKPSQLVPYMAKRLVARSMALMETTDMIFCQTLDELKNENRARNELYVFLSTLYTQIFNCGDDAFDKTLNFEIIDFVKSKVNLKSCEKKVMSFWEGKKDSADRIRIYRTRSTLFAQPVVLLLYWMVDSNARFLRKRWGFQSMKEDLRIIFSDMGVALGDNL